MKRMISLVLCMFPLFTACDTIDALGGGDASDCDTPIIDVFDTPSCSNGQWSYSLKSTCWTGMATVDIVQTGVSTNDPWSESHEMYSHDRTEEYEIMKLELNVISDWSAYQPNQNSLFQCDDTEAGRASTMTWAFSVYDADYQLTDCVAYGDKPGAFGECENGNSW